MALALSYLIYSAIGEYLEMTVRLIDRFPNEVRESTTVLISYTSNRRAEAERRQLFALQHFKSET